LAVAGVATGQAAAQAAKQMYWSDQGTAKVQRANLDGTGVQDLITTGLVNPVGIALDLAVGGLVRGFQPSKAGCKNVTSNKGIMIALAPGALSWDCTGAGLAVNAGDHLKMTLPGLALTSEVGGLAHGFQPSKVVCKDVTTKQKVTITLAPGTLSWDCAAEGLLVSPGDKLKMIVTGSEP
jgi:hypothetical protein